MYISLNLAKKKKKKFHRYLNPKRICFTSNTGVRRKDESTSESIAINYILKKPVLSLF